MASFCDQGDIERRIGLDTLVQCTDDNNDGVPDDEVISDITGDTDSAVRACLYGKGWSKQQLDLLTSDKGLRRLGSIIAADFTLMRRKEFVLPDGTTMWTGPARTARLDIVKYATGELRSPAEDQAGTNPNLESPRSDGCPVFYVAPNPAVPGDRGAGGF